ncbi:MULTISPECIES: Vms1/Ankzf1 family peptidyl-tRNA hydrolase [Halorussus]|uniref:Vms1/Ankzf1 family peptidyl-tRNA hydrolase n=1 Tax=Halorussus TaxID=1070314 RepID=UPI000E2157AF|nr:MULTISPECIES: Vms1/Ankzf1 family peptidyl-tRNA hydrolase [Halorussus]NHN59595.1 single-stranded DNA-binding protein [Halorussus sp. JP-T4]
MDIEDYERHERIERVEDAEATADDLLTVAVPPDRTVGEALERVEEDRAESEFIEEESEDAAYLDALEAARGVLQHRDSTPENGLVVYAGVVDGEVVEYVFDDLPSPVSEFVYERGNEFRTDVLDAAAGASKTFGLLVVERGGAALGLTENDDVQVIETFESDVMGKTKAGGQSAQRFERERERQKEEFFESVGEEARRAFLGEHDDESASASSDVDGLLLGGTDVTVDDFREGDHLDYRLEEMLVGDPVSVEYASEQGLHQLVEKASDRIEDAERREMREALDRFFDALDAGNAGGAGGDADGDGSAGDDVVYGREAVDEALEYDAVETALVSADLPFEAVRDVQERATEEGGDCVVVPTDFDGGRRFDEAFGGMAAILRFPIE